MVSEILSQSEYKRNAPTPLAEGLLFLSYFKHHHFLIR